jgi:HEAT repeat protein
MESPDLSLLNQTLGQLQNYGPGSSRGALVPIDQAVRASLGDPEQSRRVETALLAVLSTASTDGRAYLIQQLTLVGGTASVSHLAALLGHPELSDPARRTLEVIPGDEVLEALRAQAPHLTGIQRAGVIQSLGRRRDAASVQALARELNHDEAAIVEAALRALGRIASPRAGRVLRGYLGRPDARLEAVARDAARECADRLQHEGHSRDASRLLAALDRT